MNQTITFLSDGGDTVRDLQFYHTPFSEHVLDWFHITMRITVMKQMAKGLPDKKRFQNIEKDIERVKWYLWRGAIRQSRKPPALHGNVFMALQVLGDLLMDLEPLDNEKGVTDKLWNAVGEFNTYITNNGGFIPNYRDRYYYGEAISTGFVESTVNQVVSKRMVKKQQMRWTKKGAHLLLQVRTQVLNDDWRKTFCRWYPEMKPTEENGF